MEIRNITEKDLPAIIELVRTCEPWLPLDRPSNYWMFWKFFRNTCYVALEGDNIVGAVMGFIDQTDPRRAYLHLIAVRKGFQKKGIGSSLYKKFEQSVKKTSEEIYLVTRPDNLHAISFYKSLGFSNIREFLKVGVKRLELWKKIRD